LLSAYVIGLPRVETCVVEMISELPDSLNARGGPVKLYRPAISYISIYKGLDGPSELKESSSKLNIRDVAEQGVAEVDIGRRDLKS
jgi:hypothetical protein